MPTNTTTEKVFDLIDRGIDSNAWFNTNTIVNVNEYQFDTPETVETKLASPGAVMVVGQPLYRRAGSKRVTITIPIEIYENPQINRATGGTLKTASEIAENVWAILDGYTYSGYPQFTRILPQSMEQVYAVDGEILYVVMVETSSGIVNTSY